MAGPARTMRRPPSSVTPSLPFRPRRLSNRPGCGRSGVPGGVGSSRVRSAPRPGLYRPCPSSGVPETTLTGAWKELLPGPGAPARRGRQARFPGQLLGQHGNDVIEEHLGRGVPDVVIFLALALVGIPHQPSRAAFPAQDHRPGPDPRRALAPGAQPTRPQRLGWLTWEDWNRLHPGACPWLASLPFLGLAAPGIRILPG